MADVLVRQRNVERSSSGSSREDTELPTTKRRTERRGSNHSSSNPTAEGGNSSTHGSSHGSKSHKRTSSTHGTTTASSALPRVRRHLSSDGPVGGGDAGGGSHHSSYSRKSATRAASSSSATRLSGSKAAPARSKSTESATKKSSSSSSNKQEPSEAQRGDLVDSKHKSRTKPYIPKNEARMPKKSSSMSSPTTPNGKKRAISTKAAGSTSTTTSNPTKEDKPQSSLLSSTSRQPIHPNDLDQSDAELTISDHHRGGSILDTSRSSNLRYSAHTTGTGANSSGVVAPIVTTTPASLLGGSVSQSSRLSGSSGSYGLGLNSSRSNSLHASSTSAHSSSQQSLLSSSEGSSRLSVTRNDDFDVDAPPKKKKILQQQKQKQQSKNKHNNDNSDSSSSDDDDDNSNADDLTEEQKAWKGIEKVLNDSCSVWSDDTKEISERVQKAMGLPQNMAAMATGKGGKGGFEVDPKAFDVLSQEKVERSNSFRKELPRKKQPQLPSANTLRKTRSGADNSGHNSKSLCGLLPQSRGALNSGESSVAGGSAIPDLMDSSFSSMQSTETMSTILTAKKPGLIVENEFSEGPMKDFLQNVTKAIERKQTVGPVAGAASFSDSSGNTNNSSNTGSLYDAFQWSKKVESAEALEKQQEKEDQKLAPGQKRGVLRKNTNIRDQTGFATANASLNGSWMNASMVAKKALSVKIASGTSALGPDDPAEEDFGASLPSLTSYGNASMVVKKNLSSKIAPSTSALGPSDPAEEDFGASLPSLTSYGNASMVVKKNLSSKIAPSTSTLGPSDQFDGNESMPSLSSYKTSGTTGTRESRPEDEEEDEDDEEENEEDENNSSMPSLYTLKNLATTKDDGDSSMPSLSTIKDEASVFSRPSLASRDESDSSEDECEEVGIDDSEPNMDNSGPDIDDSGPDIDDSGPDIDDSGPDIDDSGPDIGESARSGSLDESAEDDYYEESGSEYSESMTELDDEDMNDSYYYESNSNGLLGGKNSNGLLGNKAGDDEESEEEDDLLPSEEQDVSISEGSGEQGESGRRRTSNSMNISQRSDTGSQSMGGSSRRSYTGSQSGYRGGEGFRKPVVAPNLPILGVTAPSAARLKGAVKFEAGAVQRPSLQPQQQPSQAKKSQQNPPKTHQRPQQPPPQETERPHKTTKKPKQPPPQETERPQKHTKKLQQENSKSHEKPKRQKSSEKLPKAPRGKQHPPAEQVPGQTQQFVVKPTKKKKKAQDDKEEKIRQWKEQFEQEQMIQQQQQQEELIKQQLMLQQQMLMNQGGMAFNNAAGGDGQMVMDPAQMNAMMHNMMNANSGVARGAGPMSMPTSSHSDQGIPEHNSHRPGGRKGSIKKSKSLDQDYDFSYLDHPSIPVTQEVDADTVLKPMNPSQMDDDDNADAKKHADPKSSAKGGSKKDKKPPSSLASRFKKSVKKIKNFGGSKPKGLSLIDTGLNERQFFPDLDDDDEDDDYTTTRSLLSSG